MRKITLASFVLGLLGAGCTLLMNTAEPIQCRTNGDCDGNPSLRGRVCEQGFCVVPTAPIVPVSTDAGPGCVSTQLCTQANSSQPSICRKAGEPCIPIHTKDCPKVVGAWNDPKAIFIGAIEPQHFKQLDGSLPEVPYIDRFIRAVNLAVEEHAAASPQGIVVGGQRRPLAVVHCDSYADPTKTLSAFDHLVDVVGAQSLIVVRDEDLATITQKAITKQVAIACADCGAPIPIGPLAWQMTPATANEAPLTAWRVADLETKIRNETGTTAPLKVAVLAEGSAPAIAFTQALAPVLKWNNDKSITENGSDFFILTTGNPLKEAIPHGKHADDILAFGPDILVVAMGSDFPKHFLTYLESKWPANKKPHYILTQLSYEVAPYADFLAANDELRERFSGTHPLVTPELRANIESYTVRYRMQNNNKAPDSNYSGYEAFYSLAFAITSAGAKGIVDGPTISAGFESLVSGTTIDLGPQTLNTAMALLSSRATVDLRGLWSNLDWNTQTRENIGDAAMFCFTKQGGALALKDDAGPHYIGKTKTVTGSYACD